MMSNLVCSLEEVAVVAESVADELQSDGHIGFAARITSCMSASAVSQLITGHSTEAAEYGNRHA